MLDDYNDIFGQKFDIGGYARFKKDVSARLSHKKPYERVGKDQQLDLLIVVNQMLTGFDSKWVNTLYLDKVLVYENLIQAFSRTNRLFNKHEKPFGSIRYYRYPHTMKKNIEDAVKLYSGDKPRGLFADKLPRNIEHMNEKAKDMISLFSHAGINNFEKLPDDISARAKFAKLFKEFSSYFEAAQIQGFTWEKKSYSYMEPDSETESTIECIIDEKTYDTLLQRYKELRTLPGGDGHFGDVTFPIDPYLTELNTGIIDNDYMNSRFEKWMKQLSQPEISKEELENTLEELHASFAFLSQDDQKYANIFLHDVQNGDVRLEEGKALSDYLASYKNNRKNEMIKRLVKYFGLSQKKLEEIMNAHVTKENINEYGRFTALKNTVVKEKAAKYFASIDGKPMPMFRVNNRVNEFLTDFVLSGGKDIPDLDE